MMYAHGGSLNRGCEAIVRSSLQLIKQNLTDANVYLASELPESDRIIDQLSGIIDASQRPLSKFSYDWFISLLQLKLLQTESYALRALNRNILRHIEAMDVCLSIGGDNYCYGEQPSLYMINEQIKRKGKKLVLWACSIGEEDLSDAKLQDLQTFDLILARESLTYDILRSQGLSQVKLCADPAFTMEQELLPLPAGWREGQTIGLNFSPLVHKRNEASLPAVRQLLAHILSATDFTVALTPHVIQDGNDDHALLQQLYEEFQHTGRVLLLPNHLTATQYKGYIGRMRLFIGARTHATIAAYSTGVPTMVLGYSVKSRGIAKDLFGGEAKFVLGIDALTESDALINMFDELVAAEASIITELERAVPLMKQRSVEAAYHLKELTAYGA